MTSRHPRDPPAKASPHFVTRADKDELLPTVIGVTNVFFVKALPHWPNVLAVGKRDAQGEGAI